MKAKDSAMMAPARITTHAKGWKSLVKYHKEQRKSYIKQQKR